MIEDIEQIAAAESEPEAPDGQKLCAYCGKPFTPKHGMQKYHPACKKKKEKERKRAGSTSKTSGGSVRRSLWLVRKEAEVISYILQYVLARKYGLALQPPGPERREHLAHVIKKLETQPPFSYIQQFLYRLFPVFDPEAKPGRSAVGDAAQYLFGWYEANPELQKLVGAAVPPIFSPDGAQQTENGQERVESISYEEYISNQRVGGNATSGYQEAENE